MSAAAGIVLAGGRSSRMGSDKAALEWHGSTLLRRVTGLVARAVDGPVVVVGAPGRPLPALPAAVAVVQDPLEGLGPLQGLAVGLAAVAGAAEVAYLSAVDVPFLHPAFVRRVLETLGDDADVALPEARGHRQPLAAAYRTALAAPVAALVAEGRLAPAELYARCRVRIVGADALLADPGLRAADPDLESLVGLNRAGDYAAARARPAPEVRVDGAVVRAATLGAALRAAGPGPDRWPAVTLNGVPVDGDPELPLVAGDVLGAG